MASMTPLPEYDNKWIDAVVRMTRLTVERKMQWRSRPANSSLAVSDDPHATAFEAEYNGVKYLLHVWDQPGLSRSLLSGPEVRLHILDDKDSIAVTFPQIEALEGLLIAVRRQLLNNEVLEQALQKLYAE